MTRNRKQKKFILGQLLNVAILSFILIINGCNPGGGKRTSKNSDSSGSSVNGGGSGGGANAGQGNGGLGDGIADDILANGKASVKHIVDPFDGTYKAKVTIPKNFTGLLYLSGLNVTSLTDRLIKVRFKFGRDQELVEVPAFISRAPGIIPQTDIEVIVLDMKDQPFNNIRLLYDLYDYNDYDVDNNGTEFETGDIDPVTDPRDSGVFCRGLKIEHDPTFEGSALNGKCDAANEKCLYAYAKVKDSGLYDSSNLAISTSEPQLEIGSAGYSQDSDLIQLKKCLPDTGDNTSTKNVLNITTPASLIYGTGGISLDGKTYTYNGPYRGINRSEWEISESAVLSDISVAGTSPTGLFQSLVTGGPAGIPGDVNLFAEAGIKSFMFPRFGKMDLQAGVEYFGNTDPVGVRALTSLVSSGETSYMDGCSKRVSNYDEFTNEGISSCNVTATIELVTTDVTSGDTTTLTVSTDVKLQLIRPSLTNFQGKEVLYSSMKTCSNSNACGANECCFNSRCWGKELVSQCLEDVAVIGNGEVGANCGSDFECSSLCCNQGTGACGVHLVSAAQTVLCSKAPGQSCVAKEWCRKENVSQCFVVKTGLDTQGTQLCALRCYNVPTFGDCVDGICRPAPSPTVPSFDPSDPNACANAIDPPTGF